ncbi:MAG: leucine-rich repeat domain-containing protein [Kiritimatiellae bacterium]|nr:leucine-rich repeat domain-containing protein [Kiritimatiellia bacterium]MCO5044510.1 leucine-rich repeat domain-containing protein [Kiritimatiellia bacterium]MCO5067486.1 leucine-rich repeat domain-containing protein [Kiritimatiellia bacterium]
MRFMPVALLGFALASLHPSTFADELFGDFYYTATPTEITITLYGGSAQSVIVPSQITNVPVRTIKATAFAGQSGFTNVIIPDSVTTFQGPTFSSCSSLASISLGGGLSALGDAPFAGCTNLATIAVHATNAAYSSIDGVLFNKSATTLLYYPLGKSGAYTIPDGTLTIAEHAFEVHPKLSSVTMPDSVVNIANSAFNSCTALGSVQVGNGVTNIGDFAFISCTNLSDLTLGSSVKTIGPMAFSGCTRLARVTLPGSLSNIGSYAFAECSILERIYFRGNAPIAEEGAFELISGAAKVYYLPGTSGWGPSFAGLSTALWNPTIELAPPILFITGTPDIPIAVESCTNLVSGPWMLLNSTTLANGDISITDNKGTNSMATFYRVTGP